VLDVAVLGLGILATYEVKRASSSASPPVTAGKTNDGLQDESDDWVDEVAHILRGCVYKRILGRLLFCLILNLIVDACN
jgi:hypothetical protein